MCQIYIATKAVADNGRVDAILAAVITASQYLRRIGEFILIPAYNFWYQ